ncbi:MAG: hypothetical protein J6U72_04570 [Clostridia bacterium]|nr:hypothetical protein [Clostridia bacterium]
MKKGLRLFSFVCCALTALAALYLCTAEKLGWALPDALKTPLTLNMALLCLCFIALTLARTRVRGRFPETGIYLLLAGYVFLVFGAVKLIDAAGKDAPDGAAFGTEAYAFAALCALTACGGRFLCPEAGPSRIGRFMAVFAPMLAGAVCALWLFGKKQADIAFGSLAAVLAVSLPALPGIIRAKKGEDTPLGKVLGGIKAVVIDEKLEKGFEGINLMPADGVSEEMLLSLAAGALSGLDIMPSALDRLVRERDLPLDPVTQREECGDGVKALLGDSMVLAGSAQFLTANGVACEGEGLNIARNGKYMGELLPQGKPRPEIVEALSKLGELLPLYAYRGGKSKKAVPIHVEDGAVVSAGKEIRLKKASAQKHTALLTLDEATPLPYAAWTGDDPEQFCRDAQTHYTLRKSVRRRMNAYLVFEAAALILAAGTLKFLLNITIPLWIFPLAAFAAGLILSR